MPKRLTYEVLEQEIIDLLAEELKEDPADLRTRLAAEGQELPIDSILLAEILTRVEALAGVKLPADAATANSMRSIHDFVHRILEVIEDQGVET